MTLDRLTFEKTPTLYKQYHVINAGKKYYESTMIFVRSDNEIFNECTTYDVYLRANEVGSDMFDNPIEDLEVTYIGLTISEDTQLEGRWW